MSDSIRKWHELQEEKKTKDEVVFIFESPDGGKTIKKRPFEGGAKQKYATGSKGKAGLTKREVNDAYQMLADYDESSIEFAYEIIQMLRNE